MDFHKTNSLACRMCVFWLPAETDELKGFHVRPSSQSYCVPHVFSVIFQSIKHSKLISMTNKASQIVALLTTHLKDIDINMRR